MAMDRDSFNRQSLGPSLNANTKQARVLMVGAGGIGCELLKNLVLTGFHEVHIVDLDTIDLSNLNRQFLFRHEHIKRPKALVAKETAHKFNPNVNIVAHHANIKETRFSIDWYKGFTLVFNALDNLDARRHVNRMCLAADVPLIESGTTGFNGQVQVIKKEVTACYDCTSKDVPKSFPVCTIRSTPSQPIHCIVWAKSYLLNEIFGTSEDQIALDDSEDAENASEIAELKREAEALRAIRESVGKDNFAQMLFDKVFSSDIERLRSMEVMWQTRTKPTSFKYDEIMQKASDAMPSEDTRAAVIQNGQKTWSLEENLVVFEDSLERLSKRMLELHEKYGAQSPQATLTFDKDDQDTLDFVASSANLRSFAFEIDRKSRFDIKQMAGNIIPAIATTNAIVAGLCVLESFKVLRGEYEKAQEVFLTPFADQRLLAPDRPRVPNPDCPVCRGPQTLVYVDLAKVTLNDLVEDFVRLQLGYGEREIAVTSEAGLLCDPDETDNLEKKLSDLDESDEDTFVNLVLGIQQASDLESLADKPIKALGPDKAPEIPRKPRKEPAVESNGVDQTNGKRSADTEISTNDLKRQRADDPEATQAKKSKTIAVTDDDVVIIADDAPIVLD